MNSPTLPWRLATVFTLLSATSPAILAAPDAETLVAQAQRLDLGETSVRSFSLEGVLRMGRKADLRFRAHAARPGKLGLLLMDDHDGTPILACEDGVALVYDPVANEALIGQADPYLRIVMEHAGKAEQNFVFDTGFRSSARLDFEGEARTPLNRPRVDIPSLLASVRPPWTVSEEDPGQLLLSGTSAKGNRLAARFQPGRAEGSLLSLEMFVGADSLPVFVLRDLRVNAETPLGKFKFDAKLLDAAGIPHREVSGNDNLLARAIDMAFLTRTLVVRGVLLAPADEAKRTEVEKMYPGQTIDWDRVEAQAKETGRKLRALVDTP